ncbi:MAG: macro domain-containing protein [Clostridiales bacterium]|nr:macro domain-containing protein [Clostridiales bacterium]
MKVRLLKGDLTKLGADAIVSTANSYLSSSVMKFDGPIHAAAGPELAEACKKLGLCRAGEAKITDGYDLSADYVIHTVVPIWRGGVIGERNLLTNCYVNSVELAIQHHVDSIAFPLLAIGAYGFSRKEALTIALKALLQYEEEDIEISLVFVNSDTYMQASRLLGQLTNNK